MLEYSEHTFSATNVDLKPNFRATGRNWSSLTDSLRDGRGILRTSRNCLAITSTE